MSGHSKWSTIKRAKGAADAARGKIFTRHARNIELAAREGGGDPDMNAALAAAIEAARADNLPKENIERSTKKGTGELEGVHVEEKTYEGYGPGGVALLINTFTDNPNRTTANIRHLLTKGGGKLAESGSVAFQFEQKGIVIAEGATDLSAEARKAQADENELSAIDAGAEDTEKAGDVLIVKTDPKSLMEVRTKLTKAGLNVKSAELIFEPVSEVLITEQATAQKVLKLIETLEKDGDVDSVSANFDIPEELLEESS
ncbi:MAG: YebC/PmpR family DNA-binding transcriptional regulator [Patescibacteria group bacterium]